MTNYYGGYGGFSSFGYPFIGGLLGGFLGNVITDDNYYRYPQYRRPYPPYPYYRYPRYNYPHRRGPYRRRYY